MDWIRRNWPDVLIGVALIAVIAGIIVTLLGGGSVFDFSRSPRTPAPEPSAALTTPQVADEPVSPLATPLGDDELGGEPGDGAPSDPRVGDQDEATAAGVVPVTPTDGAQPAADAELVQPLEGETAAAEEAETTVSAEATSTQTPTAQAPATETATGQAVTAAATAETAATSPDAVPGAESGEPWRIVVGTFRVPDNAERLAAEMRDEGHPVFIAAQGELNVVLVGPFADEAATRALAQQFRDDGREADVFRQVTATGAAPVSAEAPVEISPVETAPVETAAVETATAPSTAAEGVAGGSRYMQVGAYRSDASAAPQRERLEALGYEVTPLTTDTGLIRLLIGPFSPEETASVRARLDAQGIEHTPGPATLN